MHTVFYGIWLCVIVYVYTTGVPKVAKGHAFGHFELSKQQEYMVWYCIVALYWISNWISAWVFFIIASTACVWYFSPKRGEDEKEANLDYPRPICTGMWRGFAHGGSLAFGSFIVSVV